MRTDTKEWLTTTRNEADCKSIILAGTKLEAFIESRTFGEDRPVGCKMKGRSSA